MNLEELKLALVQLALEQPEWVAAFVGGVVKENLMVESQELDKSIASSTQMSWKQWMQEAAR